LVNKLIKEQAADFIAFSRPFIREPYFPEKRIKSDRETVVKCIFCNKCVNTLSEGNGVYCVQEKKGKQD
jgi:2,4-dienoyl-CoA reductase-like NADH-dependent reductase (Old Yellow Enzyme family)